MDKARITYRFDRETERIEQMIRGTGNAVTEHGGEDGQIPTDGGASDWPDTPYVDPTYVTTRYEHHTRTPWFKIVATVTGAVATGALLGFFVLSMFSGQLSGGAENGGTRLPEAAKNEPLPNGQPAAPVHSGQSASADAADVAVHIEAREYTLLQNGVFSNRQGAEAAIEELKKKGMAAAYYESDKFYVYAGLAPTRDEALSLSLLLQEQKLEVFVKPFVVPAVSKLRWHGERTDAVDTYFSRANELVRMIGGVTAFRLKEETPAPLEESAMQSIRSVHRTWSGSVTEVNDGFAEEEQAVLQKMNTALNTAVMSLEEYNKNPSAALLWQAQTAIMEYIFGERQLLGAAAVPG